MSEAVVAAPSAPSASATAQPSARGQGLWNIAGRLSGAIASLAIVPLAARSLSGPEFGPWIVLSTVSAVLAFTDLGISSAVVSDLAVAAAEGDTPRLRDVISTATALLTVIAITVAGSSILVVSYLGGERLLGVTGHSAVPIRAAVLAFLLVFSVSLPLTVGPRVLTALHRSDVVGKAAIIGSGLQVLLAAIAAVAGAGVVVFSAVAGSSALISGALCWVVATHLFPASRPSPAHVRRQTIRPLLSRGAAYLTISVAGAIGFETDALVIARALGSGSSAAYLVPAKVFLMVPALLTLYFTPMWPAVARAVATGDRQWLRDAFRRALATALLSSAVVSVALALSIGTVVAILSPATARPGPGLIAALVALTMVLSISAPVAAFLSGLALVRVQAVSAAGMALVNLAGSILWVRTVGLVGPPVATVVSQTVLTLVPLILVVRARLSAAGADVVPRKRSG